MKKLVDGELIDMTAEEIAELDAMRAAEVAMPPAPVPLLVASGVFTVADGWLEGVGAAAGIGMAFALDVGTYWIMFNDPQPDLAYAAPASSSQGQINVQRYLEYVEVTVRDGSGALVDPSEFSITIMRAL